MKQYFFFFLFVALVAAACGNQDQTAIGATGNSQPQAADPAVLTDSANFTNIEWIDSTHQNLGQVKEGQLVDVSWRFKNTGTKPLVITSVSAGCGCTASAPPKEPIAPGKEGLIQAQFDSKNQTGTPTKNVLVRANTKEQEYQLYFTAQVVKQ